MNGRFTVLIPAAGVGARFGADMPKQYSLLLGKTVLQHTVERFFRLPEIGQILIVVAPDDAYIDTVFAPDGLPEKLSVLRCGGSTRAQTVRNGIQTALSQGRMDEQDWVLVHDAARCCVPPEAVRRLLDEAAAHEIGGLLALPVADTVKRADSSGRQVEATVSRDGLWLAQTPQMFRAGLLHRALSAGSLNAVTDEASAVEALGVRPLLVQGDARNIKLTRPQDAALAEFFLQKEQTA